MFGENLSLLPLMRRDKEEEERERRRGNIAPRPLSGTGMSESKASFLETSGGKVKHFLHSKITRGKSRRMKALRKEKVQNILWVTADFSA